jgi:hypothetical protein
MKKQQTGEPIETDLQAKQLEQKKTLRELSLSYEDLLNVASALMVTCDEQEAIINGCLDDIKQAETALSVFSNNAHRLTTDMQKAILEMLAENKNAMAKALISGIKLQKSHAARKSAHKAHAETSAMKTEVGDWYRANKSSFSSMAKAAEAAKKRWPLAHSTLRKWIGEINKSDQ